MNEQVKACEKTGKARLSEAAALRRRDRYEDIKRVYLCPFCGDFHLTSQEDTSKSPKRKRVHKVTAKQIKNRIKQLMK